MKHGRCSFWSIVAGPISLNLTNCDGTGERVKIFFRMLNSKQWTGNIIKTNTIMIGVSGRA